MKKMLSLILACMMLLALIPAMAEDEGLPPMTTEEITLSVAHWGQSEAGEPEVIQALIAQFEAAYPNITVEFIPIELAVWDQALTNMAAEGNLPDVFWVTNVPNAVANEWAMDITDYLAKDPDAKDIYPAMLQSAKIGDRNFSYPAVLFPHMIYLNITLFEQYGVDLPDTDWTWDDYFDLADELSHPEEYNYGVSNPYYHDFFPAAYNGNQGRFGWDGEKYNFDEVWIEAVEKRAEVVNNKIAVESMTPEEAEAILGNAGAWGPGKGIVAMHVDWPWSMAGFKNVITPETGCQFIFYPLPTGDAMGELAIVDNGVINASTEYPREAWELAKWMSWGPQAALCRQKTYRSLGYPVSRMPVVRTPEVWQDLVDNAEPDVKAFYTAILERGVEFVPSNWQTALGYQVMEDYYNLNDIEGRIWRGELEPEDVAPELQAYADKIVAEHLETLNRILEESPIYNPDK